LTAPQTRPATTPPEAFRWFRVNKGVNKAGNNDPTFNEPIEAK